MKVHIVPNANGNPPGKLADAELHFEPVDGPLSGNKLIGFSVWESASGRRVTFPARQYSVNAERRSFALVRPIKDPEASLPLRDVILLAYANWEAAVDETARENAEIGREALPPTAR